jgi:hypothetical protein
MTDATLGLERSDDNTESDRSSGSSSVPPVRAKKKLSEAQLSALAKGRSSRTSRASRTTHRTVEGPIDGRGERGEPTPEKRDEEVPPPRQPPVPVPVKREEEPTEELADILVKPRNPRKGRSDRGGTRGNYIDKAVANKVSELQQASHLIPLVPARPTSVSAPRYNIVIV